MLSFSKIYEQAQKEKKPKWNFQIELCTDFHFDKDLKYQPCLSLRCQSLFSQQHRCSAEPRVQSMELQQAHNFFSVGSWVNCKQSELQNVARNRFLFVNIPLKVLVAFEKHEKKSCALYLIQIMLLG